MEDKSGNLWFGTNGRGVSKYDGKSFTHYTDKEGLSSNYVRSILEDKSGNLWFATYGGGVSKYDGKSFTHYMEKEGLNNNIIWSILEDKSGNLWFSTSGGGVSKYVEKSFNHYTEKEGLSNISVFSILEDKMGNLWFGTEGGGVNKYDGKSFKHFSEKEGLSNNIVYTILEDKSGNLWFGTEGGGVSKFDGKSFIHFTEKEGLSNNSVISIFEDKSGNLWFCNGSGGVTKYNGKSFIHFREKEGLSSNSVISIFEDKIGNLWFGTYGRGVSKYDGKNFTHFTEKEGLSNNFVYSILEDKRGNMWFGTNGGGVTKYNGNYVDDIINGTDLYQHDQEDLKKNNKELVKSFTHYTNEEGLSNNTIWSIVEDKSGNLWLSSEKGLNCFLFDGGDLFINKSHNGEEIKYPQIMIFNRIDGLKTEDFFQKSVLLDSKNRIWWGSGKALTMLNLNEFKFNEKAPEIQLENIYLQENFVDYNNIHVDSSGFSSDLQRIKFSDVARFHNYPINLELPFDINHLTFQFSAIDWYAPHKIKYQYKLEGLDIDWSNLTSENKADYRNIPFGNYTFIVKAIGSANKWSKTFEYSFIIHPPWWRTWWAYGSYSIIIISSLIFFIRWRERKLKKEKEILEKTVEERTAEVVEQKNLIEEKHKEITDSINYAERIQRSFLATKELLNENLKDYFVFFQPKDVVSGDFYWASKLPNGNFAYTCADSTGHGVPGAIMSILNISSLELAIKEKLTSPSEILNYTRTEIINRLKKDGSEEGGKDGMDCSLIILNKEKTKLTYAAANNPIWIIRENELIELKPDKMPVGKHDKDQNPFTKHEFDLQKGDLIYSLTDGMPDQFGGTKGKKYKYTQLKEFLISIAMLSMHEQHQKLKSEFENWKGDLEQVDDVCVIGVKI